MLRILGLMGLPSAFTMAVENKITKEQMASCVNMFLNCILFSICLISLDFSEIVLARNLNLSKARFLMLFEMTKWGVSG